MWTWLNNKLREADSFFRMEWGESPHFMKPDGSLPYLQHLMETIPFCYIDTLLYKDPSQDTTSHITMLLLGYMFRPFKQPSSGQ
jgi:hypothetical protein